MPNSYFLTISHWVLFLLLRRVFIYLYIYECFFWKCRRKIFQQNEYFTKPIAEYPCFYFFLGTHCTLYLVLAYFLNENFGMHIICVISFIENEVKTNLLVKSFFDVLIKCAKCSQTKLLSKYEWRIWSKNCHDWQWAWFFWKWIWHQPWSGSSIVWKITRPNNNWCSESDTPKAIYGKKFHVNYFGCLEIDKRYIQTQYWKVVLQWIVAEIKRKFVKKSISLEIHDGLLIGKDTQQTCLIDHDLHNISKFSRTHLDTTCFAYVTRKSEYSFLCHLYQADHEDMVSGIIHTERTMWNLITWIYFAFS